MLIYILLAILLLGILVTVHEFGHFIFARLTGIEVMEFSVGFGPKLLGTTTKAGTQLSLRAIPFGGYCAFYDEDVDHGDPRSFRRQKVWKRMLSVLMGPGMNFVLALVVAVGYFWIGGVYEVKGYTPFITEVEQSSPAEQAGIQPGDIISMIGEMDVLDGNPQTLDLALDGFQSGQPIPFTVKRGDEQLQSTITPFYDETLERYRIGISIQNTADLVTIPCSLTDACTYGFETCVQAGGMIFEALGKLVSTGEGIDSAAGPVGIVSTITVTMEQNGFNVFFDLLVMLSINLGIMNLLPFPGLDGARFLFMVVEGIAGKPINPQIEAKIHFAGYVLLLTLIIAMTVRDVFRLF